MLHYKPADGYFGDPIPFYWDGEYHMFYLLAPPEPKRNGADHTVYAHLSTRDFLHWREHPTVIEPTPGGPDAVSCWTGSVIERNGTFYLFYTGHGRGIYEWPQTVCLATSPDLETWTKWPHNPLLTPDPEKYRISDWRDPFVFWCEQENCYLMSITSMKSSANFWKGGCLVMARSQDLLNWEVGEPYYYPGNHCYPECSDLFQINNHWYLVVSIFHKTCYRVSNRPTGPWHRARTDSFDGVFNYAAKTISNGDRRFIVGWIRTKHGNKDDGNWEWAGHMAFPRELVACPDGTLEAKLPAEFAAIRGECRADLLADGGQQLFGETQPVSEGLLVKGRELFAQVACPGAHARFDLECEFTLDERGNAGIVFNADGEKHPGYEVAVDVRHQLLTIRKHTDRFHMYYCQDINVQPGEPIRLRVILEETVVEAFVNDRFALSGRIYHQPEQPQVSFYAEESNALVRSLRIYELNELDTVEALAGATAQPAGREL